MTVNLEWRSGVVTADSKSRRRFEQYARFVSVYLEEDEPLESFDSWERYMLVQRHVAYCASFFQDVVAFVSQLSGPALEITIDSSADLARAPETVLSVVGSEPRSWRPTAIAGWSSAPDVDS